MQPVRPQTNLQVLGLSGKMASGKDSVGARALEILGVEPVRLNIGDAIRAELDTCLERHRRSGSAGVRDHLLTLIGDKALDDLTVSALEDVYAAVAVAATDFIDGKQVTAYSRTPEIRKGLQQLAYAVRRYDPGFWVDNLVKRLDSLTPDGRPVLISDVREPLEVLALARAGAAVVRINVTQETQIARLSGRDGIAVDQVALNHPNETALDDLDVELSRAFALIISNDGELEPTAQAVAASLRKRWDLPLPGLFIVFEGIERSGKSTLSRAVYSALKSKGYDVVATREPGATPLGVILRQEALSAAHDPVTEALLFAADRASHTNEVLVPALAAGSIVLCDRFEASSIAYQGSWRGLGEQTIRDLSRFASNGLQADITIWLDVDPAVSEGRRSVAPDKMDEETSKSSVGAVLAESFARQFDQSQADGSNSWWRLDASTPAVELAELVVSRLEQLALANGIDPVQTSREVSE